MLQCYLDDSGSRDLPVVTLGGFLSTLDQWEGLEPRLNAIMDDAGVPVFHAMEFHRTKPPFADWKRIRKRSFAEEVFSACHGHILFGRSWTLKRQTLDVLKEKDRFSFGRMSPLCVCFSALVMSIVSDQHLWPLIKEHGLWFLIEAGNPSNDGIEQFFARMAKHPAFEGCLRSVTFVAKDSCRAIQLADFFVFYSRRHTRNTARFNGQFIFPACPYLLTMQQYVPIDMRTGIGIPQSIGKQSAFKSVDDFAAVSGPF